jgi:hypothetical protein
LVCVLLSLNVGKFDRCLLEISSGKAKLLRLGRDPKALRVRRNADEARDAPDSEESRAKRGAS